MNRKSFRGLFFLIVSVTFCVFSHLAWAAKADSQEFQADMVSRSGKEAFRAKVYVSSDKICTETEGNIIITRLDKNISLIIMPSEKMYMEQAIDRKALPKASKEYEGEVERLPLGRETIDGRNVEKFKVTYTEGSTRETVYQWVTDSGFPVKTEAVDGAWAVEYKNLSLGTQPDTLFEVPPGFQKFSMPFSAGADSVPLSGIMQQIDTQ